MLTCIFLWLNTSTLQNTLRMSDLIAPWQSVHLHQLTLSIQNQLCEGEQLRGGRTFWQVGISLGGMPKFFESLGKEDEIKKIVRLKLINTP